MKTRFYAPLAAGRAICLPRAAMRMLACALAGMIIQTTAFAEAPVAPTSAFVMPQGEWRSEAAQSSNPVAKTKETSQRAHSLALYYKARRLEQETDDPSALTIYLEAAKVDPTNPTLNQRIIEIYTRAGRLNEALARLEESVARFPKDPTPLLSLARFLNQHHAEAPELKLRALRTAEAAVAQFPDSTDAVDHLVRLHLSDQNREKAQAVITTALRSPSKEPRYWLSLVTPTRNAFPLDDRPVYAKNLALVSTGIEKALSLAPDDPGVQEAVGDFFSRHQQPARALTLYEKCAAARPGNLKTRQKLGQLLRMADRNPEAITLFESLIRIDAADTVSRKALVSLYEKTDPGRSLTHRAELLRLESGDPRDYATTTNELLADQRPTEALTLIRRGIYFNPKAPQLPYLLSRVLSEKADYANALDALVSAETMAKERNPKLLDSAFYYSWGATAVKAQRFEDAEARYRQSIEKAPPKAPQLAAPAYNDLGFLWLSQNKNLEAAGELLQTANDLVKDHAPYLDSLGWWYYLKKDFPNAVKTLRRAVSLAQPDPPADLLDHLAKAESAASLVGSTKP